jgi:hypothetical protein
MVVRLLQQYFEVPNRSVFINSPIEVGGYQAFGQIRFVSTYTKNIKRNWT